MSGEWDTDTLVKVIGEALRERDFEAVIAGIKVLATVDARKAQDVYDTIQAGLMIAGRQEREAMSGSEAIEHPDDEVCCPRCGLRIPRRMVDAHLEMKCIRL